MAANNRNQSNPTFSIRKEDVERQWWVIDATDKPLGRVAERAAVLLRGKYKPSFTPHIDCGDFVVVVNAEKVKLTGKKEIQKTYMSFSGYVGGHKTETAGARRARRPTLLVERAVRGMVPHTRQGRAQAPRLKVYAGGEHPHTAQQPRTAAVA